MKHSPGPWKCHPGHNHDAEYFVFDENGDYLTLNEDQHEANARIIELAPEMLQIIQMAVNNESSWLDYAKELLRKTRGQK